MLLHDAQAWVPACAGTTATRLRINVPPPAPGPGRRSTHAPARVYTARLRYTATQLAPPELTGVHTLRHAGGRPFAPPARPEPGRDVPDPEAVRWRPATGHFLWTSEGDFARGFGPQLRESRARLD